VYTKSFIPFINKFFYLIKKVHKFNILQGIYFNNILDN